MSERQCQCVFDGMPHPAGARGCLYHVEQSGAYDYAAERADAEDASPVRYVWIGGHAHDEDDVPRDPS